MNPNFTLEQGKYGRRLTLTGPWHAEIGDYMRREEIVELYLNHARGWTGDHIKFLEELPFLIAFGILDFTIKDVSAVQTLMNLRSLEISTYCKTIIDFGSYTALEECVFYWRDGSDTLFACNTLRSLFIHRYNGHSSAAFAQLSNLEALFIANAALVEVKTVGELNALEQLGLYNLKKLTSLSGVDRLRKLTELEIDGCTLISDIQQLSDLGRLRKLHLIDDGKIVSLNPLRHSCLLEELLFYGSTNILDGDLSIVENLPRLKKTSFQNRRHYSHKRE